MKYHLVKYYLANYFFEGFTNIVIYKNQKIHNIFFYFLIFKLLNNFIRLNKNIKNIQKKFDIDANTIQITKVCDNKEKNFILNNNKNTKLSFDNISKFIQIKNDFSMKPVIIDFNIKTNGNTQFIKNLYFKYEDNFSHDHSLINILNLNKIKYNDNSRINIKYIPYGQKKILCRSLNLVEYLDSHICAILI